MKRSAVVLACLLLSAACGEREREVNETLRSVVTRTENLARTFSYDETTPAGAVGVRGDIEDDGRYRTTLSIDGRPTLDEVVNDDAVAARLLDSSFRLTVAAKTREALAEGGWVVDRTGAPELTGAEITARSIGRDPVTDALTVLRYLRAVLRDQDFKIFNENDLDYRPDEDTFPKPAEDSGVIRYDAIRPELPTAREIEGGAGARTLPSVSHFRRMAIYVEDGRVTRVLEHVELETHTDDLLRIGGLPVPENLARADVADAMLDAINRLRRGNGEDPIRTRRLEVAFSNLGGDVRVRLPEAAARGDLETLHVQPAPAVAATPGPGPAAGATPRGRPSP